MIKIINRQKKVPIKNNFLESFVKKALDLLGYPGWDIGIWITNNRTIRKYNLEYRNKNAVTDILSFPYHIDLKAGDKIIAATPEDENLGDIIISAEFVQSKFTKNLEERLKHLLVHGICHLLGYTHDTDKTYKQMKERENFILKSILK